MRLKLSDFFSVYPSDQYYYRFERELLYKNVQRIYTFSLLIPLAVSGFLLYVLPAYIRSQSVSFELTYSPAFLLSLGSLGLSMLLVHAYASRLCSNSSLAQRQKLSCYFALALAIHLLALNLFGLHTQSLYAPALLGSCFLLISLYWPLNRFVFALYGFLALSLFLESQFTGELQYTPSYLLPYALMPLLAYLLARQTSHWKQDELLSLQRIEAQARTLRHNNRSLLQQRHTLDSRSQDMHDCLFRFGKERGLLYANDALARLLGFQTAAEMFLYEEKQTLLFSREQLAAISLKVNQQGYAQGLELYLNAAQEKLFWAEVSCMVYPDENTGELIFEGSLSDISFRKKALQEALINATRLEQAETVAGTGFFDVELSSGQITLSKGCARLLRALPDVPYSLSAFLEYIHPQQREQVRQEILQALAQSQGFNLSFQLSRADKPTHLSCKADVVNDRTGKQLKLLATVQDISAQYEQEKLLIRSEAYIRAAFQHNHFGIILYNTALQVVEYNKALQYSYKRLFGGKLVEQAAFRELLPEIDYSRLLPYLKESLAGKTHTIEYCFLPRSEQELWAELHFSPVIAPDGSPLGGLLMLSDISDRKQGEQLIETLSHLASDSGFAMLLANEQGTIEWANAAFHQLSGYTPAELNRRNLVSILQIGQGERPLSARLASTFNYRGEGELRKKEQNTTQVYLTANPLHLEQTSDAKFVWVLTEVSGTEAAHVQAQRQALQQAESQLSRKETFLSTLTHELRTPLNAVIGMAHHLAENRPRPDQAEDLEILRFSAKHLLTLINDILDMSKLEAGKITIHQAPFNLREVLSSLKKSFQAQTDQKNLQFRLFLRDEVPEWLVGDRQRFIQILSNLLSNAIKFTSKGSIRLTVSAAPYDPGRCLLQVSISDTGSGIPADKLAHVFERFEQLNENNHAQPGTGLGLAITKQLLELQGGEISAESALGEGSTFRFSLPVGIAASPAVEISAPKTSTETCRLCMRVLLVEDNLINQKVAGKFLQNWGVDYDTAENGAIALQKAREQEYDLVLMDLQMPVMDGYQATRELRKLPAYAQTPIIALTAAGSPGSKPEIQEAGLTDVVFKPFQPEELLSQLQRFHTGLKAAPEKTLQLSPASERLDLTDLLVIASDDQAFLSELLKLYVQQFNEIIPQLGLAVDEQDIITLRRILHKIKPSLILLRQPALHEQAQQAHDMLHEQAVSYTQLRTKFNPLIAGFRQLLSLIEIACEEQVKTA